ncbi:MAG TPA: helix-turn-helix transcriptional regulator [Gammaproteobacteria bacterium]|nr:helix-turn-helix transcriptional regulator [Gammaproteobacteria bacterium]
MALSAEQRRRLGAFLRSHRERLRPEEAGVRAIGTRRRTPGLRREEIAQLCGLSPAWYTWLEQGRDVSASPHALARLATELRLTPAERAYLFELAERRDPEGRRAQGAPVPPALLAAALDAIASPAYVLDALWNACAWNAPAEELFADWLRGRERNLLRYVFLDARAPSFIEDWRNRAQRLVAEFRADTARIAEGEPFRDLVAGLRGASEAFAELWDDQGVLEREGGERTFNHSTRGLLRYRQITLRPAAFDEYKLVMLLDDADRDPDDSSAGA